MLSMKMLLRLLLQLLPLLLTDKMESQVMNLPPTLCLILRSWPLVFYLPQQLQLNSPFQTLHLLKVEKLAEGEEGRKIQGEHAVQLQ